MAIGAGGVVRGALVALGVAIVAVAGIGGTAASARADASACADSSFAGPGRELFVADPGHVPPPMRGIVPDCQSRIAGQPWDEGFSYTTLFVDTDFAQAQRVLRAFTDAGWLTGPVDQPIVTVDVGDGSLVALSLAQALALPSADAMRYRAGDPAHPDAFVELSYADGARYVLDPALAGAVLQVDVYGARPWSADGVDDPSVLSTLRTIPQALPTPTQTAVIAGSAIVLTLVLGWPSALLNSVVGARYQRLVHFLTTRRRRRAPWQEAAAAPATEPAPPRTIRRSGLPGWLIWPGFALAAIIGALVDPDFGWNAMSLRVVITLFCSFLVFTLVTWAIVRAVARRLQPDSAPYLRFRWGSLVIVALAVLVARLLELEPGVIFGLVAGIAYAATLTAARSAVVTLVGSAISVAFGAIGWIGYSLLAPVETDQFAIVFLVEFLAGMTIKGVSSLPLALLPIAGLDGGRIFGWRRLVWGAAYAVGLAAFMLVLLTIPKSWGEIPGDFLRWLLLFGAYALLAIVVWIVHLVAVKRRPLPPEAEQGDQPDAITLD